MSALLNPGGSVLVGVDEDPDKGCQVTPEQNGYGFIKMGNAGGVKWQTGHQYIFHNTVFAEEGHAVDRHPLGP